MLVEIDTVLNDGDKVCDRSGTGWGPNPLVSKPSSATPGSAAGLKSGTRTRPEVSRSLPPLASFSRVEKIDLRQYDVNQELRFNVHINELTPLPALREGLLLYETQSDESSEDVSSPLAITSCSLEQQNSVVGKKSRLSHGRTGRSMRQGQDRMRIKSM